MNKCLEPHGHDSFELPHMGKHQLDCWGQLPFVLEFHNNAKDCMDGAQKIDESDSKSAKSNSSDNEDVEEMAETSDGVKRGVLQVKMAPLSSF